VYVVEDVSFQDRETGIQLTALLGRDELFGADFFAAKTLRSNMLGSRDLDEAFPSLQTQLFIAILQLLRGLCSER